MFLDEFDQLSSHVLGLDPFQPALNATLKADDDQYRRWGYTLSFQLDNSGKMAKWLGVGLRFSRKGDAESPAMQR